MSTTIIEIMAGTKIVCRKCKKKLGYTAKDMITGDFIDESFFTGFNPPVLSGFIPRSPCCGVKWYYNGRINTENGWLPPETEGH